MIYVFVAVCLFGGALGQGRFRTRACISPIETFDKPQFMGTWYAVKGTDRNDVTYCTSVTWSTKNGADYSYVKYRIPHESPNDESSLVTRTDRLPEDAIVKLVLATDYVSYAVLHSCDSLEPNSTQIMTREQHPEAKVVMMARSVIEDKLGRLDLYTVDQSDCHPTRDRDENWEYWE